MKYDEKGWFLILPEYLKFYKNETEATNNTKKSILAIVATDTSVLL